MSTMKPASNLMPILMLVPLFGLLHTLLFTGINLNWAMRSWRPWQWFQAYSNGVGDETGTLRIALALALIAAMFVVATGTAGLIAMTRRDRLAPRFMLIHYGTLVAAYVLQSIARAEAIPFLPDATAHPRTLHFTPMSVSPYLVFAFFFAMSSQVRSYFRN